jgi:N-acetylglucosamine kinase-like BadF-type ATPase
VGKAKENLVDAITKRGGVELLAHLPSRLLPLVIGVDGGGTTTRAAIMDERQRVVAEGHAGPSNPLRVGIVSAASAVREAIDKACSGAGIQRSDILAAAIGLAGVRRIDLRDRMLEALTHSLSIHHIEVVTDGDIALYGATGGRPGLVVIAGTGSICCGMNSHGKRLCAGGWGPIVGDEGAGSWIARKALQAVARATDERGPKTSLTPKACDYFRVATPEDLSTAIYAPTMSNDRLAGFGKFVVQAAREGDEIAGGIIAAAGKELGLAACAVIRRLRMQRERFPVACVGGVFSAGELVREPLRREILRIARKAELTEPVYSPVIAAARMARGLLQGKLALAV